MSLKWIGEIIGILAIIENFFIFLSSRRKRILLLKGVSDALWVANNFLVGAYTGGVLNVCMIFREFVFYNRIDKKWAQHPFWKYVFVLLCFCSPVLEMVKAGAFRIVPLLPACGSVLAVYGFYSENPKHIRLFNFFGGIPWLLYSIFTHNISCAVAGAVGIISIIVGEIAAKRKAKAACVSGSAPGQRGGKGQNRA